MPADSAAIASATPIDEPRQPRQARRRKGKSKQRLKRLSPLLVDVAGAAPLCGVSTASLYRRIASGEFGPPVLKWGGRRLIRVADIRRWVRLGLPDRSAWDALEADRKSRTRLRVTGG